MIAMKLDRWIETIVFHLSLSLYFLTSVKNYILPWRVSLLHNTHLYIIRSLFGIRRFVTYFFFCCLFSGKKVDKSIIIVIWIRRENSWQWQNPSSPFLEDLDRKKRWDLVEGKGFSKGYLPFLLPIDSSTTITSFYFSNNPLSVSWMAIKSSS